MNKITNHIYEGFKPLLPDLQGWNSIHPIFGELIAKHNPQTIIEVGTWKGASALHMADIIQATARHTHIYCVDTWLGAVEFWTSLADTPERALQLHHGYPQIYYQFLSNVIHTGHQSRITPVPNTSITGAKILKHMGIQAEMIYIDASHEFEDVKADIAAYLPLLKPGGVMFGDDWSHFKSVQDAVISSFRYIDIQVVDQNYWVYVQKGTIH